MLRFVVRRVLAAVPTLFAVVTVAFFMIRLAPGGPFDDERKLPETIEKNLRAAYHLDESLVAQYFRYMGGLLGGDFGPSLRYHDYSVTELIALGAPVSMRLGLIAIVLAAILGAGLGTFAAFRQNSGLDHAVMGLSMTGIAVPNFVMAPLLTLVFGVYLQILPVGGWRGPQHAVLPIVALALPQIAYIARLARGSTLEVLHANFIRTARAKGVPAHRIVMRHLLKASMLPVVSYLGPAAAAVMTGSVVIEQIFGIPGIGRYFVQGALNRDYTLVLGVAIFLAAIVILFNLLVDIAYSALDPKIRYGK
jgi:oligopeptide transport system permease protein